MANVWLHSSCISTVLVLNWKMLQRYIAVATNAAKSNTGSIAGMNTYAKYNQLITHRDATGEIAVYDVSNLSITSND